MKALSNSVLEQIDCESVAAKPTLVNDGLGSIVPIHVKPDRSSFEFH
jgi:hypothetical protein